MQRECCLGHFSHSEAIWVSLGPQNRFDSCELAMNCFEQCGWLGNRMVKHPQRNEQPKKIKTEAANLSESNVTEENGMHCNAIGKERMEWVATDLNGIECNEM